MQGDCALVREGYPDGVWQMTDAELDARVSQMIVEKAKEK